MKCTSVQKYRCVSMQAAQFNSCDTLCCLQDPKFHVSKSGKLHAPNAIRQKYWPSLKSPME